MHLRVPFRNLLPEGWANLALAALAFAYATFIGLHLLLNMPFEYIGQDFPLFYASAKIAAEHGFAAVYDMTLQAQYQHQVIESQLGIRWPYPTAPVVLLPPFVWLLTPLALFAPLPTYALWTAFNWVLLIGYLWWFCKRVNVKATTRSVLALALSLPALLTLVSGQVNILLAVTVGQAFLAVSRGNDIAVGLWLGGLLLKPQTLILIVPGLLIAKRYRAVVAFGLVSLSVLGLSITLAGFDGLRSLIALWMGFAQPEGAVTNAPFLMMNWRALALGLPQTLLGVAGAWSIGIAGMIATSALALSLWLPSFRGHTPDWYVIWLATMAATLVVSWHSHVHMAVALLPILAASWGRRDCLDRPIRAWTFLPAVAFLAIAFTRGTDSAHSYIGYVLFTLNLIIVCSVFWRQLQKARLQSSLKGGVVSAG